MNAKQTEEKPQKMNTPNPFTMKLSAVFSSVVIAEISRAKQYLGDGLEEGQRQELLKQSPQQLVEEAHLITAAVYLRQQTEAAEATRRMIENQEFGKSHSKGPVS